MHSVRAIGRIDYAGSCPALAGTTKCVIRRTCDRCGLDGVSCVVVEPKLRDIEPRAYRFLLDFAKDNELVVIDPMLPVGDDFVPCRGQCSGGRVRADQAKPEISGKSLHLKENRQSHDTNLGRPKTLEQQLVLPGRPESAAIRLSLLRLQPWSLP